jgi:hypothetical protein
MKASLAERVKPLEFEKRVFGARVGTIVSTAGDGRVTVDFPGNTFGPLSARWTGSVGEMIRDPTRASGRKILLLFENDDPELPIIVDVVCESLDDVSDKRPAELQVEKPDEVFIDGRRVTFDAKDEIVLRCGKASVTLTKAGKVLIKGAYLLARSSGVNRIKGASVQIN